MKKPKFKEILPILSIIILFLLISFVVQTNTEFLEDSLTSDYKGILLYISITTFATVVAPISAIPLLPVAVYLWGWQYSAIFSIIGWTIGSIIAFLLARKYGINLVKKFISLEKINKYESYISKKDIFLNIILIRIILPVDILSYIIGIFTKVDLKTYALATVIGVTPFAFVLAYMGSLPIKSQLISFVIISIIFLAMLQKYHQKIKIGGKKIREKELKLLESN